MTLFPPPPTKHATAWGVLFGAGSAFCWALGFVAARHGVLAGMSPIVLSLHRFVWAGIAFLPFVMANTPRTLDGVGWRRGIILTLFGRLPLALWSYFGYVYVPLGHGAITHPPCAPLGGLVWARLLFNEPLPLRRVTGALVIVLGLAIIGAEAFRTMGASGVIGDLLFVAAGSSFAVFGVLLRHWLIAPIPAVAITSGLSLIGLPMLYWTYHNMVAVGFLENLL